MPDPCSSCAFGKLGAGTEPYNMLRATICALTAVPFFCHQRFDWKEQNRTEEQNIVNCRIGGICQSWRAEVARLATEGRFKDQSNRLYLKALGTFALQLIEKGIKSRGAKKKEAYAQLDQVIKRLAETK